MKLSNVHLGSVYLAETINKHYETSRFPDKTARGHFDRQVETIRGMTIRTTEKGHGVISDPILVWQPDASKDQYVIVSPVELWHAIYKQTLPNQQRRLISPQDIRWTSVYKVEGDEQDVKNLIASFGPITQPLDVATIAKSRGFRKIDLYTPNKGNDDMNTNDKPELKTACDTTVPTSVAKETSEPKSNTPPRQKPSLESIVVLEELQNVFPRLDEETYERLKQDILESGECIQPLVVWQSRNTLTDGHNRLKACLEIKKERGVEIRYKIMYVEFADTAEAIVWIIRNQIHRRQLSEYDKCQMYLRCREEITKRNNEKKLLNLKQNQNKNQNLASAADTKEPPAELPMPCNSNEQEYKISDDLDIPEPSREKLRKVKKIQECGSEAIINSVRKGRVSINAAFIRAKEELKANDDSKQEEERINKESKPNVLEPMKLKVGNELIPLSVGVFPGWNLMLLKVSTGIDDLEKMFKERGFDAESTIYHEKGSVVIMSDKNYYDRFKVNQSTDTNNTKEEKESDT